MKIETKKLIHQYEIQANEIALEMLKILELDVESMYKKKKTKQAGLRLIPLPIRETAQESKERALFVFIGFQEFARCILQLISLRTFGEESFLEQDIYTKK